MAAIMDGGAILVLGKAVLWWAIPLGFAIVSLVRLRREIKRDREKARASES